MKLIGNILWFLLTGLTTALSWLFLGVIWCITIIGIPFGLQCFKFAGLSLFPFGKKTVTRFSSHPIANLLWLLFGGLELAVGYVLLGALWCITIIGIPFGLQCFKLAGLAIAPFGAAVTH